MNWKTNDIALRDEKIKERKLRLDLLTLAIDMIKEIEVDYKANMKQSYAITKSLSGIVDGLLGTDYPSPELEMIKNMR